MTKPVLRVEVSNSGEPVYLPVMAVRVDPPLTLILPLSHDCKFLDADLRTSLQCSLSNPIKRGSSVRHATLNAFSFLKTFLMSPFNVTEIFHFKILSSLTKHEIPKL